MTVQEALQKYPSLQEYSYGDLVYTVRKDDAESDTDFKAAARIVLKHRSVQA